MEFYGIVLFYAPLPENWYTLNTFFNFSYKFQTIVTEFKIPNSRLISFHDSALSPTLSAIFFCFSFRPFQAYHFDCVNIFVCFGFVNVWMYPLLVVRIQTEERWWIFQTQGWAREGPVRMWQWCLERYLDPLLPLFRFYLDSFYFIDKF